MSVEPATFVEHATWLARHRDVVPLHSTLRGWEPGGAGRRKEVVLTFDDGFASVYEHALPVLVRLGLPATVFLVGKTLTGREFDVDWVDRPPSHRLRTLDMAQIREMQAAGVTFESHSYAHADLTRMSFHDCVDDLRNSRELLEAHLGQRVRLLAYPRGRHNADVRAAAERAGYEHAFTLPDRREVPGPYALPRVGVYHGNSVAHLRLKVSAPYLSLRTSPLAERVRRGLGARHDDR
ncbi:MAG TPA: polysaccharide deacetylase family protein [Marmoricola sp.]|nr:polysaccharide deacetylase family protein [Marmoricola sp.]